MFYTITVTNILGKPLFKYAFTSREEAEKYFRKIQDEQLYSHVNLVFGDATNKVLYAVYLKGNFTPDYPDAIEHSIKNIQQTQ